MMTDELAGKRIFVTGATGFIGGHLARRLYQEGAHVLALERTPGKGDDLRKLGIEVVRGDITNTARMESIIGDDVQIVMHIAAWLRHSNPDNALLVNVEATRHLVEISASADIERFVYTSSVAVYGLHGDKNVDEGAALKPYGDPYGDSKIQSEEMLHRTAGQLGLDYVIVRPGMVYGPGSPGWTVRMVTMARRGSLPMVNHGQGTAPVIYIDDLVDLLILCTTHPGAAGRVFNGVGNGPVTLAEFLSGYMAMIPTRRAIRMPGWMAQVLLALANPFSWRNLNYLADQLTGVGWVSNQQAKQLLGWQPKIPLEEGLIRSEQWLRSEGLI
jgi:nucleoside-diphosphate-sugar epimerase